MQRVLLILSVSVGAARHQDDLPYSLRLDQELEESLILAKLGQDLACVEGHVHIVAIFGRKLVNQGVDNHRALFLEHLLHALLLWGQLLLSLVRIQVKIVIV